MSARYTEEEDQDSDYPDLMQDAEDEDAECNNEEEDKGEDEEPEDENCSALDTGASLLGGNYMFAGLIFCFIDSDLLYTLIPIYFAVEDAIDPDEIQSDRFYKHGFDGSGPTVRVRPLPALVYGYLNSKFGIFYTSQGAEWENKLFKDRMTLHPVYAKMWHSFSKCVKVSVRVLKVSVRDH